jgi:hypothetical protein
MMLSQSELIRKAYHIPNSPILSSLPLAFGGLFNMSPLHLILLGARAQELMLDVTESKEKRDYRISLHTAFGGEYIPGFGSSVNYDPPYFIQHRNFMKVDLASYKKLKSLSLTDQASTLRDIIRYQVSLHDLGFVYSLTGVDTNQIFLATLFHKPAIIKDKCKYAVKDLPNFYRLSEDFVKMEPHDHTYQFSKDIGYLRETEMMKFDFEAFNIPSTKTCKPMLYETFEMFGFQLKFDNLQLILADMLDPIIRKTLKNPTKIDVLKGFITETLKRLDVDDTIKVISKLTSKDITKDRIAYMHMPSGVNIDTVERFWAYSTLYNTRRELISNQRPQLFTPSYFRFEFKESSQLQHLYLIINLLFQKYKQTSIGDFKNLSDKLLSHYGGCPCCPDVDLGISKISQFITMLTSENFEVSTNLPFVVYKTTQVRGKNVWFGRIDFSIHTPFGSVSHYDREGCQNTVWEVVYPEDLNKLHYLYKLFCRTRDIDFEEPVYDYTGVGEIRVGFNDLNNLYLPPSNTLAMVLKHSQVVLREEQPIFILEKQGSKFYYAGDTVDFSLYQIYDINQGFYEQHNLRVIRDMVFDSDLKIDKSSLISQFSMSKLYRMLALDQDINNTIDLNKKYKNNGLLGQPCSLTRALAIGDINGETRYRSSVNPKFQSLAFLEFKMVEDMPVLDMMPTLSLVRMTYNEKLSIEKVCNNVKLTNNDKLNLKRLRTKIGGTSFAMALTMFKGIFKFMNAGEVIRVPTTMRIDFVKVLLDVLADCMGHVAKRVSLCQYDFSRRSFWSGFKSAIDSKDMIELSKLMTLGLKRCHNDDNDRTFRIMKSNIFTAAFRIDMADMTPVNKMVCALLVSIKDDKRFDEIEAYLLTKKNYIIAKRVTIEETELPESETLGGAPETIYTNIYDDIVINKEALDLFSGIYNYEEDLDGCLDDMEELDESFWDEIDFEDQDEGLEEFWDDDAKFVKRPWSEDSPELEVVITQNKNVDNLLEKTALWDYSKVTIKSTIGYITPMWLGRGDFSYIEENNVVFFISQYPGQELPPPSIFDPNYVGQLAKPIEDLTAETEELKKGLLSYSPDEIAKLTEKQRLFLEYKDMLKELNLFDERMLSLFVARRIEDFLSDIKMINQVIKELDFESLVKGRDKSRLHKNYLPGFSGILRDSKISAELKAIFGDKYIFLLSGKVCVTKNTYKLIKRTIKQTYKYCNNDHKAMLCLILSALNDVYIDDDQKMDDWFIDSIFSVLNLLEDKYTQEDDYDAAPPVASKEIVGYQVEYPYE